MKSVQVRLQGLRTLFVVYLALKTAFEILPGADWRRGLELGLWPGGMGRGALLAFSLAAALLLAGLGLVIFRHLLLRRAWARVALLVVGWLAVADTFSSLLVTLDVPGLGRWLGPVAVGGDWGRLALLDRISDLLGLLYWGLLVYTLQADHEVKREFVGLGEPAPQK